MMQNKYSESESRFYVKEELIGGLTRFNVCDKRDDEKYAGKPRPRGHGSVDGPFKSRETAQLRADRLNERFGKQANESSSSKSGEVSSIDSVGVPSSQLPSGTQDDKFFDVGPYDPYRFLYSSESSSSSDDSVAIDKDFYISVPWEIRKNIYDPDYLPASRLLKIVANDIDMEVSPGDSKKIVRLLEDVLFEMHSATDHLQRNSDLMVKYPKLWSSIRVPLNSFINTILHIIDMVE